MSSSLGPTVRPSLERMRAERKKLEKELIGRKVEVLSNHNGQPYGHSRKSWKGEVCVIKGIFVDLNWGVTLTLEGHEYECGIPSDEVGFV